MRFPVFGARASGRRRSPVEELTKKALRALGATYVIAALLLASFSAEHFMSHDRSESAQDLLGKVAQVEVHIRLHSEKLTSLVSQIVLTGDRRLVAEYEMKSQALAAALQDARTLSDADDHPAFHRRITEPYESVSEIERAAITLAQHGFLNDSRFYLQRQDYRTKSADLAERFVALNQTIKAEAHAVIAAAERREHALYIALVVVSIMSGFVLWHYLSRSLNSTARAFAEAENRIDTLARYDQRTGLPNQRCFEERLAEVLAAPNTAETGTSILSIELRGLSTVSAVHGQDQAMGCVAGAAEHVMATVEESGGCFVGQFDTTQFMILTERTALSELQALADRIVDALAKPVTFAADSGHDRKSDIAVTFGCRIGIARYPSEAATASDLMRFADLARSTTTEDAPIRYFENRMEAAMRERVHLIRDLKQAISAGEIVPYFQPLVALSSGKNTGFEVLARWQHPERGVLPPGVFLPLAEELNLVGPLTFSVMRQALNAARDWPGEPMLAINVSPDMLDDRGLIETLLVILAETGFPAERLEIEITENAIIRDLERSQRAIEAIKAEGIRVAVDDFGTGYSSLAHLSRLPFDKIKIDRSFVQTMAINPMSAKIVAAVIGLGRSLGLATVAEGIETPDAIIVLGHLGCDIGQGYYWSKPVPAEVAVALLDTEAALPADNISAMRAAS